MTPPPTLQPMPGAGFLRVLGLTLVSLGALSILGTMLMSVVPAKLQTQASANPTFPPLRQGPVAQATKTPKPPKLGRPGGPPNDGSAAQPQGEFVVIAPVGKWSESIDVSNGHFWFDGAGRYRIQKGVDDGPIFESTPNANIGDAKTVRFIAVGDLPVHVRVSPVPLNHVDTIRMFPAPPNQQVVAPPDQSAIASHLARAQGLFSDGKYAEALSEAQRALDLAPQNADALQLRQRIKQTQAILKGTDSAPPQTQPGYRGGIGGGIYRIGGGVSQPSIIHKVEPEYSEEARKAKWQGTVKVSVIIDETGHARNITVEKPLGLGLDQKAIEAVQKWLFKPGMKDGKPVAVYASIDITFHLL